MPFDLVDIGDCNQVTWNRNNFLNYGLTASSAEVSLALFPVVPSKLNENEVHHSTLIKHPCICPSPKRQHPAHRARLAEETR